jgi:D-tyrosyl-tRNA(Tyr) deacylase
VKILLQRVSRASVTIAGRIHGEIGTGFLALVGCRSGDTVTDAEKLATKTAKLRVFEDAAGKMNLSVMDIGGSILAISQFTLYADTSSGSRPGFSLAGDPAEAKKLYLLYIKKLREILGQEKVAEGIFGAEMKVELSNEGPCTVELVSESSLKA